MRTPFTLLWVAVMALTDWPMAPWWFLGLLAVLGLVLVCTWPSRAQPDANACVVCDVPISEMNITYMCPTCYRAEAEYLESVDEPDELFV